MSSKEIVLMVKNNFFNKISSSKTLTNGLLFFPVIIYTFYTLGPLYWTITMSFRPAADIYKNPYAFPSSLFLDNFIQAFTDYNYSLYIKNSLIVTVVSLTLITISASMAAYVFGRERFNFKFREGLFLLIFIAIMFPPQIIVISLYQLLVKYDLYNTLLGLILVYSATELPLAIYLLRAFYFQIPSELDDAARIDGCNEFQVFWTVMFPIAKPVVLTVMILNLIRFWNEYMYASIFITKKEIRTLPLANMFYLGEQFQDLGMLAAGVIITSLPIIILYMIFSEHFIRGMTEGAVKM